MAALLAVIGTFLDAFLSFCQRSVYAKKVKKATSFQGSLVVVVVVVSVVVLVLMVVVVEEQGKYK